MRGVRGTGVGSPNRGRGGEAPRTCVAARLIKQFRNECTP